MEWPAVVIAGVQLLLAFVVAVTTASWKAGRGIAEAVTKDELNATVLRLKEEIDLGRSDGGESMRAIRQKITDVEFWARDNLMSKERGNEMVATLERIDRHLEQIQQITVKVDTMWAFQMRRAMSEVVEKGLGSKSSPLRFSAQAYDSMKVIQHELVDFYAGIDSSVSDGEVLLLIESVFGDRLLDLVCIPCGLSHGACLILAYAIAKQTDVIELKL